MRKDLSIDQDTLERLAALAPLYGGESHALHVAIQRLHDFHFASDDDEPIAPVSLGLHVDGSFEREEKAGEQGSLTRNIAGQIYTKSPYGSFYTVSDNGKTRALEGPFCDQVIFPVAERFAQHGGEWRYHYDHRSGFLHGVATINGEVIPESGGTNGWYAMVLYLKRAHPEDASGLPDNPHP